MMQNNFSCNIKLSTLLTIIFIVLKLCNLITWSWWWVISPILIKIGLWVLVFLLLAIVKFLNNLIH